ncbi:MAG: hypothetical protein ACTSR7_17445, partial [Promethearchaeota archaeon]
DYKLLRSEIPKKFIIKSRIKKYVKSKGCNIPDFLLNSDTLNSIIKEIIDKAIRRTKSNGRKTVSARNI